MSKATLYVWTVNVVGFVVIAISAVHLLSSPIDAQWLVLAALALVSGATVLRLPFLSVSFSVGDAFSFAALFLFGAEAATLTVALDSLTISLRLRGSISRTLFNVAAPCIAMWCAGVAVFKSGALTLPVYAGGGPTLIVGVSAVVIIMFVIGTGLIAVAVSLHDRRPVVRVWRQQIAQLWMNPVACAYVGVLMAVGVQRFGVAALLAVTPIPLILYFGFRAVLGRMDDHVGHLSELSRMHQSTIEAFASAVDAKDQVTHGHIRRVQTFCVALTRALGADDAGTLKALEAAALLHDVGKIGIPEHILNKPGPLTPAEFEVMKGHVSIGVDILSTVEFPFPVVPIVGNHHENWDGTGYPAGIRGEDIPLGARILSVVDCFDALTSDRPYRAAMSVDGAFAILRARRGNMYDPKIVDAFIELQPRLPRTIEDPARPPAMIDPQTLRKTIKYKPGNLELAQNFVHILSTMLRESLCVAYEIDGSSSTVVAIASAGPEAAHALGHRVALGHGVSGWVAVSRSQIDETDAILDFEEGPLRNALAAHRCSSVALSLTPPLILTVYGPPLQGDLRKRSLRDLTALLDHVTNSAREPAGSERSS